MKNYDEFLKGKMNYGYTKGIQVEKSELHDILFEFQKDIIKWALNKGRSCIFADCGLGKTFMQLEWAKQITDKKNIKCIIFAPLSVNEQTIQEAEKIGIKISRFDKKADSNIIIANYENIDKINPNDYNAIVLDESSILKSIDGKTRTKLIKFASNIEYRLACTATPAPNDITEICNHVEFIGIMKREEMLSKWFFNNGSDWQLKGHAVNNFYKWMTSWAFFLQKPSDLGYPDKGFNLPELDIKPLYFDFEFKERNTLFDMGLKGIEDRMAIRKASVSTKAQMIADIVNSSKDQWIIWCGIDLEADTLHKIIVNSSNLRGADNNDIKTEKIMHFKNGDIKALITKPKIAGFGMNFQNCHNMIFFGLSDSYESYYQCIRRCYRFGQKEDVKVLIALAGNENEILDNVLNKERTSKDMAEMILKNVAEYEREQVTGMKHEQIKYSTEVLENAYYKIINGDSCVEIKQIPDNSQDLSIFSPPFASLYTYSNSERDLGNCDNQSDFLLHFKFIIQELLRIMKPGRNICVHCMNLPTKKMSDGFIGIKDFRGDIIRAFTAEGFIYHAEVTIDKNPQIAAIRTHAKGLMFKQVHKDSSDSRMGLADYICVFKKPGDNAKAIIPDITNDEWIRLAHPVWYGIRETETLNSIKADKDEKHICPLQLEVIENCLKLWSNKGDSVFSPFMGIGSEGYQSILLDRKFIGIELKKEYFNTAVDNLGRAILTKKQGMLF